MRTSSRVQRSCGAVGDVRTLLIHERVLKEGVLEREFVRTLPVVCSAAVAALNILIVEDLRGLTCIFYFYLGGVGVEVLGGGSEPG